MNHDDPPIVPARSWLELSCRVAATAYAALEAALEQAGALAITQSEGDSETFAEPGIANQRDWSTFRVQALFAGDADVAEIVALAGAAVGAPPEFEITPIADQVWAETWKTQWRPQRFAHGLYVCPSWCAAPADARHVVRIDPGQAFGTGTHETTALCLDWLATQAAPAGQRVVDYGCGTAVLALAAAALGAARVFAVDVDPAALAAARENCERNRGGRAVRVGPPDLVAGVQADIVVANILLEPLLALQPCFADLLPAGGQLALAGLLADQMPAVLEAYGERFTMAPTARRGEWVLLTGRRR